MNDNESLMKQAEGYVLMRRIFLTLQALAYIACIGSRGMAQISTTPHIWNLVEMVGWPLFMIGLLGTLWTMRRTRKNRQLAGLVDDERTKSLNRLSFVAGYWVMLLGVAAVYTATYVMSVDIKAVMPILLALGVGVPSLVYAFLYRS